MAGSFTADAFYFDLGDPRAYVEAERLIATDLSREWIPARSDVTLRCAHEGDALREDVAREVQRLELQPLRWPDPFPFDSEEALLAATYAKSIGRIVAFSLAAFRQAFAGGPIATGIHSGISGSAALTCSAARYASGEAKSK